MSSILKKRIKGRDYTYLVKSLRLPDGRVKTVSRLLKPSEKMLSRKGIERKYKEFLEAREADAYEEWAAANYQTDIIFSEEEIRKIERMRVGYRRLVKKLEKPHIKDIMDRFTVNFTYDSNAIEGNSLTLKDVEIIIDRNEDMPEKNLREVYETKNSRRIVEMLFRRKFRVTHENMIRMHRMLMKNIDERTGYKKLPNVIFREDREVHTTPPEKVREEMEKLINWHKAAIEKSHPLEVAATFHGKFEKIHPFADGNGRVGRFLINAILINNGYPPLIIRKTTRAAYMNAIRAFDYGHEDRLQRFLLEKFKQTYRKFFEIYVKYAT